MCPDKAHLFTPVITKNNNARIRQLTYLTKPFQDRHQCVALFCLASLDETLTEFI